MCQEKRNFLCAFCSHDEKCKEERANPICHLCQREGYYRKANHVIRTKRNDATIALCERHYADYLKYS